jgi:heat shock protein beta
MSFLRGIVDSDTLPLNVSREMLQQHASLKTIKKKLTRKALDLVKGLADDEKKCQEMPEGAPCWPAAGGWSRSARLAPHASP